MEDSVFPSEAVAKLMKEQVVEARLHTDTQNTLTAEQFAKNREVQAEIAGTKANPYFVFVDPVSGKKLLEAGLQGNYTQWPEYWIGLVNEAVALLQAERKAAAAKR